MKFLSINLYSNSSSLKIEDIHSYYCGTEFSSFTKERGIRLYKRGNFSTIRLNFVKLGLSSIEQQVEFINEIDDRFLLPEQDFKLSRFEVQSIVTGLFSSDLIKLEGFKVYRGKDRVNFSQNGRYINFEDTEDGVSYTLSYKQRLKEKLGVFDLSIDSLTDYSLVSHIKGHYFGILDSVEKRIGEYNISSIKSPKDAIDYIFAYAIKRMPIEELQDILDTMKKNKVFEHKHYYSRLHSRINKMLILPNNIKSEKRITK